MEDALSDASKWERGEREDERRVVAAKLGGGEEETPFRPTPSFIVCRRRVREGCSFLCLSFCFFCLYDLLGAHLLSPGIGLGERLP